MSIGGYFRLFAHWIIVPFECKQCSSNASICDEFKEKDLGEAVCMDTDVVIIANLCDIMRTSDNVLRKTKEEGRGKPLWMWNQNSSFIVLDLINFEKM